MHLKYNTDTGNIQPLFMGADSSSKQCASIYPAQLVGGRWPPSPHPMTQLRPMHKPPFASAGIYWAGKNCTSVAAPGGRTAAVGSTTTSHRLVVSKCAFSRGPTKRTEHPGHPRTLPPSVPSCWSITSFPACVILPQMNRQPMCI